MPRQQSTQHSNCCLENLRLGIHIEVNPAYNISDGIIEALGVVEDDKGVEDVDEGEREVARNVVGCDVCTARDILWVWERVQCRLDSLTGSPSRGLDHYMRGVSAVGLVR